MNNLIFSLNSVVPVFLVMSVGFYLSKKGIATQSFVNQATSLVFYVALPAKLFLDVSGSNLAESLDLSYTAYLLGGTFGAFAGAWLLALLFVKDRSAVSAFVHSAFRGNFVYVGLPICQNILGKEVIPSAIMVITFVLPFYNILATIVLSCYDPSGRKVSWKRLLKDIVTNPMITAILLALPFSLLGITLPYSVEKALSYLGQISTPMALLFIGAGIRFSAFAGRMKWIVLGSLYKVVMTPLIFVIPMVWAGFESEQIATAFVLFSVPSAMNAYIVTKKMGGDDELGAAVIVATMLLSVITMPVGIWLIKSVGII
ncbi:MAG: AEC family transporter [Lacrimispora celerecrescens]|nr:AEC family transporter [Lacrimispora celerecrescens]